MSDTSPVKRRPGRPPAPGNLRRISVHHDQDARERMVAISALLELPLAEVERRLVRYALAAVEAGDPRVVLFPPKAKTEQGAGR